MVGRTVMLVEATNVVGTRWADCDRIRRSVLMKTRFVTTFLAILVLSGCAASESDPPVHDPALLEGILEDVRVGWEQGDGTPFYTHLLDWDGARYFEGGGQNVGLRDLVENHVEPEAELGLRLEF